MPSRVCSGSVALTFWYGPVAFTFGSGPFALTFLSGAGGSHLSVRAFCLSFLPGACCGQTLCSKVWFSNPWCSYFLLSTFLYKFLWPEFVIHFHLRWAAEPELRRTQRLTALKRFSFVHPHSHPPTLPPIVNVFVQSITHTHVNSAVHGFKCQ